MKNKRLVLTNGFLKHYQMDSHKTQGHHVDNDGIMEKLTTNEMS
jgi:hypothetical protein